MWICKVPAFLRLGFPVLEALAVALVRLLVGALTPLDSFLFIYFFRLPTLLEAQTLLSAEFQLFSL